MAAKDSRADRHRRTALPRKSQDRRYAAKLLFQYRTSQIRKDGRDLFEERIIVVTAKHSRSALIKCRSAGMQKQYSYIAASGCKVNVEFLGVIQLLRLDLLCDDDEMWYSLHSMLIPSRRRKSLVPDENNLDAIRYESKRDQ
jgi:hypothetical protein